jgi:hypothetical protein
MVTGRWLIQISSNIGLSIGKATAAARVVSGLLLIRLPDMRATTGLPPASRKCHSSGDGA